MCRSGKLKKTVSPGGKATGTNHSPLYVPSLTTYILLSGGLKYLLILDIIVFKPIWISSITIHYVLIDLKHYSTETL